MHQVEHISVFRSNFVGDESDKNGLAGDVCVGAGGCGDAIAGPFGGVGQRRIPDESRKAGGRPAVVVGSS